MIGHKLHVELQDGQSHDVTITYKVAVAWEDAHPALSFQKFVEDPKFKPLAMLAWEACKAAGIPTKVFGGFLDDLVEVRFLPKAEE